jgi:hypothetical protein
LRPVLDTIGAPGVPIAEIPERLKQYIEAMRSQGAQAVTASNGGGDIDAAISASRARLRALDTGAAREILAAKIAEEQEARTRRLLPL